MTEDIQCTRSMKKTSVLVHSHLPVLGLNMSSTKSWFLNVHAYKVWEEMGKRECSAWEPVTKAEQKITLRKV